MKIAFVGGGSLTWTPELATDLALTPEIHGVELILQDINPQSLELMLHLARMIAEAAGSGSGQVPNLPLGAVVECYAHVDDAGVHPESLGPLPTMPAAVCNWHLAAMELTLDAALTGDRELALQALRMDPAVGDWQGAERMLEEMLAANPLSATGCRRQHCSATI
jgi:alpha-galactosidase/6-phospho-beta-glucosidase family protein